MNRELLVLNVDGINWYVVSGRNYGTVNATYDDVNSDNYNEVRDVDCFTYDSNEIINNIDDLQRHVYEFLANGKLWSDLYNDMDRLDLDADKICHTMETQMGFRENSVVLNYDYMDIDGNHLDIYATNRKSITVALNERLGDIVG